MIKYEWKYKSIPFFLKMKNAAREERKADEEKSHFHRYAGIWKKYDRCCDSKASGISVYRYRSYDTGAVREAAQGDY